jgi:hypothetical protein
MTSGRRSPSPEPLGPRPIRRLHESLINRIAAGEVRTGLAATDAETDDIYV